MDIASEIAENPGVLKTAPKESRPLCFLVSQVFGPHHDLLRWIGIAVILAFPSIALVVTQPPWWRDSDGFFQVTNPPGHLTVIHWPPLYCFMARLVMRTAGSGTLISDRGTWVIVLAQHALLFAAHIVLVAALSYRRRPRIWIAVFLAACPIASFFAHCIGTESLGIISVYALAASLLWLLRRMPADRWWHWAACSFALFVCLQSRHVNLLYAALPACAMLPYARSSRVAPRPLLKALLWSLVAVAASWGFVHALCLRYRIDPVSSVGYTFQWRMREIYRQHPGETAAFAKRIASRLPLDDVETRRALANWSENNPVTVTDGMSRELTSVFQKQGRADAYFEARRRLNRLAGLVLWPPDPTYTKTVLHDALVGLIWPLGYVALAPVNATALLFDWLADTARSRRLQPLMKLRTFSQLSKTRILEPCSSGWISLWVAAWKIVPLGVWLLVAVAATVAAGSSEHRSLEASSCVMLAWGLLVVGMLAWLANCMLTFSDLRFCIPLWQNAQVAMLIAIDTIVRTRPSDGRPAGSGALTAS